MLNCIKIQGFKCFQKADIKFSNFILLAGKNSAGKSTVIQAVLALYQNSASSLAGKYMNIGTIHDVKNWIVGTGVSYIAEIIIAAFSCGKDDVLIIENPEIHLHPSGQCELMNF